MRRYRQIWERFAGQKLTDGVTEGHQIAMNPWIDLFMRLDGFQGTAMSDFDRLFIDLHSPQARAQSSDVTQSHTDSYERTTAVRNTIALNNAQRYTIFRDSNEALADFLQSDFWSDLLHDPSVSSLVDLGVGTGEKMAIIRDDARRRGRALNMIMVDISEAMLRHAYHVARGDEDQQDRPILPVRLDFRELKTLRTDERTSFFLSSAKRQIFMLIGGTLGNYLAEPILTSLTSAMSAGDMLVLGVEFHRLESGSQQDGYLFFKAYDNREFRNYYEDDCDIQLGTEWRSRSRIIVSVEDDIDGAHSSIPLSKLVKTYLLDVKTMTYKQLMMSARYDQVEMMNFMKKYPFKHVFTHRAPSRQFYNHLAFERV
jgi:hypothetical protein